MKRELNPCQGWSLKNQLLIEYLLFIALFFFTSLKFVQGGYILLRLSPRVCLACARLLSTRASGFWYPMGPMVPSPQKC